jgi:hypothetical protein
MVKSSWTWYWKCGLRCWDKRPTCATGIIMPNT